MNFQLRFSPNVLALRDLLAGRELGRDRRHRSAAGREAAVAPLEISRAARRASRSCITRFTTSTRYGPSSGEPRGVYCRAVAHPSMPEFQDTRSTIILDYGNALRCSLLLNHTHQQQGAHGASFLKVEGTDGRGAADARRQHRLPERTARHARSGARKGSLAAGRVEGLVVHRGVRRPDVEPAAVRGRRGRCAGVAGRRCDQDDGARRSVLSVERVGRNSV